MGYVWAGASLAIAFWRGPDLYSVFLLLLGSLWWMTGAIVGVLEERNRQLMLANARAEMRELRAAEEQRGGPVPGTSWDRNWGISTWDAQREDGR